jgi:hypothetical protein
MWARLFSVWLMFVLCAVQAQPAHALMECRGTKARCSCCLKRATESAGPSLRAECCLIKQAPALPAMHRDAPPPCDAAWLPAVLEPGLASAALAMVVLDALPQRPIEPEPRSTQGPPLQRTLPLLC